MTSKPIIHYFLATVCAIAWFAFWLSAFQPSSNTAPQPKTQRSATLCSSTDPTLNTLQSPTLFALPSKQGFSGTFPADQVDVTLSLERPHQPETYLTHQPVAAPIPDQTQLIESIPRSESELPPPKKNRTTNTRKPENIAFFFSPELAARATNIKPPKKLYTLPQTTVRIHLSIRPNGTVKHAFFENPTKQPALLSTIRGLRFDQAYEKTSGWLNIRISPQTGDIP